ncbi:sigma-54 interaction domain-containing protein [Desulfatibacillum alkenivorans]|jgi:transcriptional regulator with PAS, ATPase and Fis domain|nr:sigma-54 dependent transcriptional regulator [Desulfatibacillum alkenivorans]
MKKSLYHLKLYIIIPLIFSGLSILSFIGAYRIAAGRIQAGVDPAPHLLLWGGLFGGFTFVCGLFLIRAILGPVEKFVVEAESLGVAAPNDSKQNGPSGKDEMARYTTVFRQVSEVLNRVEARKLFPEIVAQSKAMRQVLSQIKRVAPTDSTVLITGESGTGKELVADSIHRHSQRSGKRFVKINCAAIPETLLESELFGYEKGAFTGAAARKPGKFEQANGGTVFLDEIGDMPLETQAKILRVLEEKEVDRLGGMRPVPVDVRVVAASNRNIQEMVDNNEFREDLFFRLNVFPIQLPPLRERPEDIPFLVEAFLSHSDKEASVSPQAMHILCAHPWHGNVRELRNVVESAMLYSQKTVEPEHLPPALSGSMAIPTPVGVFISREEESLDLDYRLQELEKGILVEALKRSDGVQAQAARLLGIKERSLWHRVKKYGIDVSRMRRKPGN